MIRWREAGRDDVAAVVVMLADDVLGVTRERAGLDSYLAAFDAMAAEPGNRVIVAEAEGETAGETGGETAGVTGGETAGEVGGEIVATYQITFISGLSLGATRTDALRFYRAQGFGASHVGFKKAITA